MGKKKKCFVLDTNVILSSPYSLYAFDEHDVVLVDVILEELDTFKSDPGEKGVNAREAIRLLESLRLQGDLSKGVKLPLSGGTVRIVLEHDLSLLPDSWNKSKPDNRILAACLALKEQKKAPILVSNDINVRIKANMLRLVAEDYKTDQTSILDEQYSGRCEIIVPSATIDDFYKEKLWDGTGYRMVNGKPDEYTFTINEFALLVDENDPKHSALARFDGEFFVPLSSVNEHPYDITPRNNGQRFAQEALLAAVSDAPLVILRGPAGTAKTFYALATGLEQTVNKKMYQRILCTRPNVKFDEDIGYLKGTEEDKIGPLTRPIFDNLEQLTRRPGHDMDCDYSYMDMLLDQDIVTAQALAYMRGRSIANTWIIIDEAQNMTPTQAFGIISRVGKGSKIILAGDPMQIDSPHLDSRTNGLSYASERMKGSKLCWQVSFTEAECERSELATEAITRLSPKGLSRIK